MNVNPDSPRQKMINLMYIVLMALLALNVSSDVLNGFSLVDESLSRTTGGSAEQNRSLYESLAEANRHNPEKVGAWFAKATRVKQMADSLYAYVDTLKLRIVREADGAEADVTDIKHREDLEAASYVMLAPGRGEGRRLYDRINRYREEILALIDNPEQQRIVADNLSTVVPDKASALGKNWQEYIFENTPVVAAVTLLTKLQSDVRYAEGEALHLLTQNTDVQDVRVNRLQAYVIPTSQNVVRGGTYSGRIILAAVDSTRRPVVYIGDERQPDNREGWFETVCNRTGDFTLDGHLELLQPNGEVLRRDFSQRYTVVDPSATVSATMMNVLYAGYDNPISVSVPGIPASQVQATMTNGTLKRVGNGYVARPEVVGKDAVVRVSAVVNGRTQSMGDYTYRVRPLPDPSPFIEYTDKDTPKRYRGGTGLPKSVLMNTPGIVAAIDDGLLNIGFRVLGFETVFFDNMGNAVPEVSQSASFTPRQKEMFRRLSRGKRFYISRVRAIGPDGVERLLPTTLEVIVN